MPLPAIAAALSVAGSVMSAATAPGGAAASHRSGFDARLAAAVGHDHARRSPAAAAAGASGAAATADTQPAASLAASARALVGDLLGAIGAGTAIATTPRLAAQAYRQTG